eukprot:1472034-Amphidinium_carterae.1
MGGSESTWAKLPFQTRLRRLNTAGWIGFQLLGSGSTSILLFASARCTMKDVWASLLGTLQLPVVLA